MSHIDELDDYEAELELHLKKEYSAVYSLFRYCVLTQDATYLCNKLDLQYVPQPSYPFFQLKMEDVWVWDKNRPTRMIPRVEIQTTSDVTVEELKGEGDEPAFTAEALAKRMSDLAQGEDELARAGPMLLAIDVGNTQTVFGLFDGAAADGAVPGRYRPDAHRRRAGRAGSRVRRPVDARGNRALLVGAAARARIRRVRGALGRRRVARARAWCLDRCADPLRRSPRGGAGPDREYCGGARAPWRAVRSWSTSAPRRTSTSSRQRASSRAVFWRRESRSRWTRSSPGPRGCPKVPFVAPERVISQTTVAALQSGLVYGFAGQVDAIVDRIRERARRSRRAGGRYGRSCRADRAALPDDHGARPGADASGPAPRLGAESLAAASIPCPSVFSRSPACDGAENRGNNDTKLAQSRASGSIEFVLRAAGPAPHPGWGYARKSAPKPPGEAATEPNPRLAAAVDRDRERVEQDLVDVGKLRFEPFEDLGGTGRSRQQAQLDLVDRWERAAAPA